MFLVYGSLFVITIIFFQLGRKINLKNYIFYSLLGSLIFFIISNLGVWLFSTLYNKNFSGLIECYIMAIPFFHNTLLGTIFYGYIMLLFQKKVLLLDFKPKN